MFRGSIRSILAVLALVTMHSIALAAGSFEKLASPYPVGSMAITEDGRFLLVSHQADDKVTVWDVATTKLVTTLDCEGARGILSRGGKVYVANDGKGTISVFSPEKKWDLVDQVEVGMAKVGYMSAPQGKYFNDHILVTTHPKRNSVLVHLVDTKNDRFREVRRATYMSVSTVSYDGKNYFEQGVIGHSRSGSVGAAKDFKALVNRTKGAEFGRGSSDAPILAQVRDGKNWFGHNYIFRGMPPKQVTAVGDGAKLVIPDRNQDVCYAVGRTAIRCIALDAALTEIGSQDVTFPEEYERMRVKPPRISPRDCAANDYQSVAITQGGKLHVFVRSWRQKAIYVAHIDAFDVPAAVAAAIRNGTVAPTAGGDPSKPGVFPEKVAVGKSITYRLMGKATAGDYELISGPDGVTISKTGVLTWKPTKQQAGEQRLKIRATIDGTTAFLRLATDVVDVTGIAGAGTSPAELANLGIHNLSSASVSLKYGLGGTSMLLLDGDNLRILDGSALVVIKTIKLDRRYTSIFERKDYFVAFSGAGIVLLNKKTGKVIKTIDIDHSPIGSVDSHPIKKVTYISIKGDSKKDGLFKSKPVLEVNESTGRIRQLKGVYGSRVSIHPTGKFLYTTTRELYKRGIRIDWNIGRVLDDFGHIDVIICYDISGRTPRYVGMNSEPGANGRGFVIAPDGKHVSYVAGGGAPGYGYSIAALRADKVDHESARYQIEAYPTGISYHPIVDLVACTNSRTIWIFDRKTKEKLTARLDADVAMKSISKIMFSPSGSRLLAIHKHPKRGIVLQSVALKLTAAEQSLVTKGYQPPPAAKASKDDPRKDAPQVADNEPIPLDKLEALRDVATEKITTTELARRYSSAVVVVSSDSGTGTGFVIGSSGYILTCAHVLPELGNPTITYRSGGTAEKPINTKAKAAVVRVDEKNDLALLKIRPRAPLPTLKLATIGKVETGENVSVIGNPGLGDKTLSHTLTTGVVSSPRRVLGGVVYIQTSAAVNPGCSGGPLFNDRGEVIGVVSLKARIENTGFAVPTQTVLAFLGVEAPFVPSEPIVRTWTDSTGKFKIEAQLIWLKNGQVRLKRKSGGFMNLPLDKLSTQDRAFLKNRRKASAKK